MAELHKIGKYDLLGLIAQGGMGNVYLARAEGLAGFSKLVVLKTLRADLADDTRFREMFLDEARLAARLNHRNIVQTNDVGDANGVYYMVMDYLEGRSLAKVHRVMQKRGERLPLALEVRILADVLAGLHHAHELQDFDGKSLGVVHRDVCPANVFITVDGQVKVVDFGVAKAKNHSHETQAGTIKGRVAYMSPEHVTGKGIDRRADVFSAGIMLWEAIEGRRFWDGAGEAQILGKLLGGQFPSATAEDVPAQLQEARARALAADPEQRFATAHAMRLALEAWLEKNENRSALADLGAKLKDWFADERARVAQAVEAAATPSRRRGELPDLEAQAPHNESSKASAPRPAAPSIPANTITGSTTGTAPFVASGSLAPPARSSRLPLVLGVGAVIVLLGLGAVGATLRGKSGGAASAAPAVSSAPAEDTKVKLTVKVSPAQAQIFVDEKAVEGNPHVATFAKGSGRHLVRAEAPGFVAKSELVDLVESTQVAFALEAVPTAAPPTTKVVVVNGRSVPAPVTPAAPSTAAAAPPAAAPPAASAAPLHTVDPANPYGKATGGRGVDPNNPYAK